MGREEKPYARFRSTSPVTWQIAQIKIRGQNQHRHRDTKTERFIKKPL